ncbi:MAG: hypothetical protein AB7G75_05880 [Candidatus Binatia bacterium]
MFDEPDDIRTFLQSCATGDDNARHRFQEHYGEDIYNFPIKIYRLPEEDAGDFYLYVFDKGRIFNRMRTFEGRNSIQFRTFLSYYVLKHLFLEWQRTRKDVETTSLSTPIDIPAEGESRTLEDILPGQSMMKAGEEEAASVATSTIWASLTAAERLDLKLLSLLECDLDHQETCLLAQLSGRSILDTLALVAEVQEGLRRKDAKQTRLADELDSVWGWILLRQKEWQEINEKILLMEKQGNEKEKISLLQQRQEIEQALMKRYQQRERILADLRTNKITTPYKDMARLLNSTVGTVSSRICRLRERLMQAFGVDPTQEERTL